MREILKKFIYYRRFKKNVPYYKTSENTTVLQLYIAYIYLRKQFSRIRRYMGSDPNRTIFDSLRS